MTEQVMALIERLRKHGVMPNELAALLPADALNGFYHLTSMYSHRGDGIPTQFTYPQEIRDAAIALAVAALTDNIAAEQRTFALGDRVTKIKGSSWTGKVVGFYSTALTPEGYAIESENEPGSVQIYPVSAIRKEAANLKDTPDD